MVSNAVQNEPYPSFAIVENPNARVYGADQMYKRTTENMDSLEDDIELEDKLLQADRVFLDSE